LTFLELRRNRNSNISAALLSVTSGQLALNLNLHAVAEKCALDTEGAFATVEIVLFGRRKLSANFAIGVLFGMHVHVVTPGFQLF